MSKPRICKTCRWLEHRAEPCCSCLRWGKGKTDHYIPAGETLGEYLERKEQEKTMDKDSKSMTTEKLLDAMAHCLMSGDCTVCPYWKGKGIGCSFENEDVDLMNEAYKHLKALQQELIDERDRYDRLVSFELAEAAELREARKFAAACAFKAFFADTVRPSIGVCPSSDGKDELGADVNKRCAEYIAEKELQTSDVPPGGAYWRNICDINAQQEKKGAEKYGQTLEENTTLSAEQRIEHAQEELIDALKYLEHLKAVTGDKLTANDYQRMAMRTAGEYDTYYDQLRNAAYGLNGEAGEVIDLLKKHEFQGHDLPEDKLIDECGDVLWYCALLADALGFSLEQVMNRNIDKLRKRYPDGFDKARSINREGEQ